MKKIRIPGWAVIFAATLLLAACASHDARMADTDMMSGPDATLAQFEGQGKSLTEQRLQLDTREAHQLAREGYANDRQQELEQLEQTLIKQKLQLDTREAHLLAREGYADDRQQELERRENEIAINRAWIDERKAQLGSTSSSTQMAGSCDLPTNAKRGSCYARIFVPGEYLTVTEKVLIKEAGERVEIVPASYATVKEQVLVEKGSLQLEVVAAQYGFETERVMVEPAKKKLVQIPAQYEQVNEQILVKPADMVWKKGTGPMQQIDAATGEILCLVDKPPQYRTVSKSILKTPASVREIEIPAVYKTVQRRVMTAPATTQMVDIPPKYKTVEVTKLIEPAHERRIPIPAQYQTVTTQKKVSEDRVAWQEILCETNMTHDRISDIQRALSNAGFNPGPIDGVIGPRTMAAVNAFQKERNLAVAKYLTIDTVNALEVSL